MSCKVMYTCDHCGKEVSPYIGKQWKAGFLTVGPNIEDIHACSFDHLALALAKTFDIPLDSSTLRLVTEKNDALNAARAAIVECDNMRAQIAEHEVHTRTFDQLKVELERSKARERELEQRIAELTAPMTVDGKTPGQLARVSAECNSKYTAYYVWLDLGGEEDACKVATGIPRDHADKLANKINARAFGQPSLTTREAVAALRRVRAELESWEGETAAVARDFIDDELARLEAEPATNAEAITLPTKPTKPLRERLEDLASYWEKGAASSSMSEGYRQASKDCAKELREAIDDPR